MLFGWDKRKNGSNIRKHGISFEMAASVFDDPLHLSVLDRQIYQEERWVTMGQSAVENILVVVHTYREIAGQEIVRIISARLATRKERKQYEEGI